MTNSRNELARVLRGLQVTASWCAQAFTTPELKVEYRVAHYVGAALPWRLLETHRPLMPSHKRRALRRMHCFRTPEGLMRSIRERTSWKARDQELVASFLVQTRDSADTAAHGEYHYSTPEPSPSAIDLRELTPARLELRAQMCVTRPDRVVDLQNR